MKIRFYLAALLAAACCAPLQAVELDARMAKIARTFTSSAKELNLAGATLTVLPFRTDKKLAEQRVDYACGELLAKRFASGGFFKMVERAQLEAALKEQALGAGGVTESATAARLGKQLGARLVVMGSVARLGPAYHMNTELVDSETGEILATDSTEVQTETFDKDAGEYLTLVPDYDALGLYLAGGFGPGSNSKNISPISSGGQTITPRKSDPLVRYYGVGLRYFISPKWLADAAFMLSVRLGSDSAVASTPSTVYRPESMGGSMVRLLGVRAFRLSDKFKAYAGAGLTQLSVEDSNMDNVKLLAKNGAMPTLRGSLEWKPTERLGFGLCDLPPITGPLLGC